MIYFKYFLMVLLGWLGSIIIAGVLGAILRSDKSKIGGFVTGIIAPSVLVFLIGKLLADKNINGTYDILPTILILLPFLLINIQSLYNSGVQDGKGNNILPVTGINMKINKGLVFGSLIGCFLSFLIFTRDSL